MVLQLGVKLLLCFVMNTCEQLPVLIVSLFAHPTTLPSLISKIAAFGPKTIYRPLTSTRIEGFEFAFDLEMRNENLAAPSEIRK